jgi:cytochrome P450
VLKWAHIQRPHIATTDLRALAHVAAHSDDFHKWPLPQRLFSRTLGGGLFVVEGAEHRRQRRLLNPAFGPTQIRNLSGIFIGKANEVRLIQSARQKVG